jgi:hypothetical protein
MKNFCFGLSAWLLGLGCAAAHGASDEGAAAGAAQDKRAASASVKDYGAKCDGSTLDTAAFQRAIDAARVVTVPAGTCVLDSVNLRAGTTLAGAGATSILRQASGQREAMLHADSGSGSAANNVRGIALRDLQLSGTVAKDGFAEHVHLAALSGVTDVTIERVIFRGFRGDGLYLGSSQTAGRERHNVNVIVRKCLFDGVNNDNRNAISIIDGDGITVVDNRFVSVTRPNMPGAIDAEPDARGFPIIRNITVRGNTFDHVGGGVGVMSVVVRAGVTQPAQNVTFEGNEVRNYVGTGSMVFFTDSRMPTASSAQNNLVIAKNMASGGFRPFFVYGKGITIRDNTWTDFTHSAMVAYRDTNAVRDLTMTNNTLTRVGTADGYCLTAFTVDHADFVGNRFIDCGSGWLGPAAAIDFDAGTSSHIAFDGNEIRSPGGKTRVAIRKGANHKFTPGTNRFGRNRIDQGLGNGFEAEDAAAAKP